MKRSEMVRKIADFMMVHNDNPFLTPLCAADGFLKFVQSEGMLPPTIENRNLQDNPFENVWEPEAQ